MRKRLQVCMALCAISVLAAGCQRTGVTQIVGGSPTSPTSMGDSQTLDVIVAPVSETFTAPCQKTVVLTATARGASTQPSWRWSLTGPSSASISDNGATATLIMRANGTYTVIATTQDGQASGSFSMTLDCGGPTGPFSMNTQMSCVLVNGEYNVAFGWGTPPSGAIRVEFKSLRDGVWRNALQLFGSSINGNSFMASRVRADITHFFRVFSGSTLWSTSEAEASCANVPACRDNGDNDGDGLIDSADPGCHTDLNPNNPSSYDPNDDDESNPGPSTSGPDPGPGPSGPGPTTPPPSTSSCSGASASLPDLTAKGQTKGFTINAQTGCHWALRSNNTHVVSTNPAEGFGTASGSVTALNSGTTTIQFIDNPGPTEIVMSQRTYTIP